MNNILLANIIEEEVLITLKAFQKSKIHGPDSLTVEIYLGFYDLVKADILKVIQESQSSGKMLGSLIKTFMALIPKSQEAKSFTDFRPISCCNLNYKLITKIISNKLNPLISDFILEEQFGFFFNHQIHDAVTLSQEASHSIKTRNIPAFTLKIDRSKAYTKLVGFSCVSL